MFSLDSKLAPASSGSRSLCENKAVLKFIVLNKTLNFTNSRSVFNTVTMENVNTEYLDG